MIESVKVLLVEDNPLDAKLVRLALTEARGNYVLKFAGCLDEAFKALEEQMPDVILLDLNLPDSQGFDTLSQIQNQASNVAVVILTGYDDPDFAIAAVNAGAQDFLVKGKGDGEQIGRAIHYAITRKKLEENLRLSEERIKGIINQAHDAVISINTDFKVTLFNPAAQKIFGYREEEILGQDMHILLPSHLHEKHRHNLQKYLTSKRKQVFLPWHPGMLAVRKNREEFPIEISFSCIDSSHGQILTAMVRDITERCQTEAELLRLATTDSLTGIWNRRHFLEMAEHEFATAKRYGQALSVMMLDIDHFKRINDSFGHATGDKALSALCNNCRNLLREADIFGRLGGEEFMVLLPQTGLKNAYEAAERLRKAIQDMVFRNEDNENIHFTISLGVAELTPSDLSLSQLIKRADANLYEAKNQGRNRVVV